MFIFSKMGAVKKTVWLTFVTIVMTSRSYGMKVVNTYRDVFGDSLLNIDMDKISGTFIVGSVNSITRLNENLDLKAVVQIGKNSSYINNVVIDSKSNSVILCSGESGKCEIRSLKDFEKVLSSNPNHLVPKNRERDSSSVVLLSAKYRRLLIANSFRANENHQQKSVPILSSRTTDNLFIAHINAKGSSAKYAGSSKLPSDYFVRYLYSFSGKKYVYFISHQPNSKNSAVVSKIARLCLDDDYFRSHVEIQLDCVADSSTQYSVAQSAHYDPSTQKLFVAFSKGTSQESSAVCSFDLRDINKMMDNTVRECFEGKGFYGPVHLHKTSSCVPTTAKPDMCGKSEVSEAYSAIEGTMPLFQRPIITFPNTFVTSFITREEEQHTVLYLGTRNGALQKVTLADNGLVTMVHSADLDLGHEVMSPMFLNREGNYLYAMTKSKLLKVDIDHCLQQTTCQECTSSLDSVCGWCVLQNRCTKQDSCTAGSVSPAWLPSRNGVCADMKDVFPRMVSIPAMNHVDKISFKLDKITLADASDLDLHCSFIVMDTKHKTMATVSGERIVCPLPKRTSLPSLPIGKDHGILEVEFQVQGKTVVKRDVSFYNCQLNTNCTSCTDSSFGCKWCHFRGMCVESTADNCINQTVPAITSSSKCPRLETSSRDTDVVVHSGQTKKIAVRVTSLMPDQMTNILCLFTYEGDVKFIPGTITSSNLICNPLKFEFSDANLPIVTAVFTVTAGNNSLPLDNPQNIKVRIYKCGPMVTNCGQCLTMDPEYECGWCTAGVPQCSLQSDCPSADWLDRAATCPNPQILRFSPMTGPIQGRTNISVTGLNLGKTYTDLEVTVAGVNCVVQPYEYESSQGFLCQTVGPSKVKEGIIKVKVAGQYTVRSQSKFMFVDPEVTDLSPKKGPVSGGTTITIGGEYMNAGTMTTVDVGGSPCKVVSSNVSTLECMTSQLSANENEVDVEVNFGGLNKLVPEKYLYVKDPEISMIEPKKTILSGGTSITAMGSQMQYIQRPQFFVEHGNKQITSNCWLEPLTAWLLCKTPKLNFPGENITETSPKEVHYGFNLDGVTTYRNISTDPQFGPLLYYPDPEIENLPLPGNGGKKYSKDTMVVIKGNFRRVNPIMQDVSVTVGGSFCVKPTATDDALSCNAPEQPREVDSKGNALVMLQIGNMEKEVGYVKIYDTDEKEKPIAIGIILGVVLPILAIITLLAICVIRRHRKHKPSEDYIPDVWKEEKKEEEEVELNHVSVKADMNGSIPDDKDTAPYIEELLSKVEDDYVKQCIQLLLISRRKLDIGDILGKGNFGVTYKATYSETDEEIPKDVAVKTLQGSQTDSESVSQFLTNVSQLRNLQHPGIMPIIGACITVSSDPMIVIPFSQNGDLKSYVRDSNKELKVSDLLDFGNQIAEAMDYLSSQPVVHGNLALRNCYLSDQKRVLVGDYGIHKELFTKEQYIRETDKNKSLVKWSAPEVLEGEDFSTVTTKSDVWSCGVVLWELLTRGVTPYPDVDNSDIAAHVKEGNRLKKPKQCPEDVYGLMLRCWTLESESRPTFRQISEDIQIFTSGVTDDPSLGESTPLQDKIVADGEIV
ncbi:plexin-A1-like isoform X2 [Mercenaria mercenaria]|uniref:plexin-A1-like isoform X2 n=1 Tax=Mercenaria mercenaria TaxID=6596 RepID=UPI00234F8FBB|nr:plexin-A1-like isoform X2 [Mercenaria mercenaria]